MKATNKRLVSMLLVLAMVLAVLPMAVFAAGTTRLYCAAPSSWTNCNVYWWGCTESENPGWPGVAMTKGDDGLWYYDVPSDAANVIFNNGSAQSSDLVMPTDDKVQYNYDAKEWVTYGSEVEEVETVYYLRGTMNEWGTSNPFTNNGDGTYTCVMDLAAGSYEYKAGTEDWGWSCPSGGNLTMTLEADDTVTFTLDINANSLTYTLASGTVVEISYYLRGSMNEWAADDASKMTKQADGTYAITLSLAAGTYEYKAATADWSFSVPGGDNAVLTLAEAADVTFVLDVAAGTLTNDAPVVEDPEPPVPVETVYYLRGDMNNWDTSAVMEKQADGTYAVTIAMEPGTYEYKAAIEDWTWSCPEANASVTVVTACDVTFVLDVENFTLTASGAGVGEPEPEPPVEYEYYVAGSAGLCGVEWDPAANKMTETAEGIWTITFENVARGVYEYKITTGSWETPSYGYGEGNLTVVVKSASDVTITFNEETTEVGCNVEAYPVAGASDVKWQLNTGASAEAETVDLRLIASVDSLEYKNVTFTVVIDGQSAELECQTVYEAVKANGATLTCNDVFGTDGYLVTYTIAGLSAEHYDCEIQVTVSWEAMDGTKTTSETRSIYVCDDWS